MLHALLGKVEYLLLKDFPFLLILECLSGNRSVPVELSTGVEFLLGFQPVPVGGGSVQTGATLAERALALVDSAVRFPKTGLLHVVLVLARGRPRRGRDGLGLSTVLQWGSGSLVIAAVQSQDLILLI